MEQLKAIGDAAKVGDRGQQSVVAAFFRALSAVLSGGGVRVGHGSVIAAVAVLFPGFTCPPDSTVRGNPAAVVQSEPQA